jgi:hypothetical protein
MIGAFTVQRPKVTIVWEGSVEPELIPQLLESIQRITQHKIDKLIKNWADLPS